MQDKILCIGVFVSLLENPPNQSLLANLRLQNLWQEWLVPTSTQNQKEALRLLEASKESANDIGADFTSLFISDIDFAKAPPYASFYLDKDQEIYSPHTDAVLEMYQNFGFLPIRANEPADSLLNELCFVSFLLQYFENHHAWFLKDELETWLYQWSENLIQKSDTQFYRGLGLLIEDFFKNAL